jgi:hypothetical protein
MPHDQPREVKRRRAEITNFHWSSATGGIATWIPVVQVTRCRSAHKCLFGSTLAIMNLAHDIAVLWFAQKASQVHLSKANPLVSYVCCRW